MGQQKFNGVSVELCDSKEKKLFMGQYKFRQHQTNRKYIKKATFT